MNSPDSFAPAIETKPFAFQDPDCAVIAVARVFPFVSPTDMPASSEGVDDHFLTPRRSSPARSRAPAGRGSCSRGRGARIFTLPR